MSRPLWGGAGTFPTSDPKTGSAVRPRRAAENMPNQGMVAEIIKLAMIRVHARLREEGMASRMLVQVHDELLLEVPEGELAEVAGLVVREMKHAAELSVPLEVEVKRGRSWGNMRRLGDILSE
jgi:DNA polymerase I